MKVNRAFGHKFLLSRILSTTSSATSKCMAFQWMRRHMVLSTYSTNSSVTVDWMTKHLMLSKDHLTPQLSLYLLTEECPLYQAPVEGVSVSDPWWSIYWP